LGSHIKLWCLRHSFKVYQNLLVPVVTVSLPRGADAPVRRRRDLIP